MLSDSAVPRAGQKNVPVNGLFSFSFTEPVTNVSTLTVSLTELETGNELEVELVGFGPGGVGLVNPSDVITALTMRPMEGLKFGGDYRIRFEGGIVDTDVDGAGAPAPENLAPAPTDILFTTFDPASVGDIPVETNQFSMTAIGDVLFVANQRPTDSRNGVLQAFDLRDPRNVRAIAERDSEFVGILVQRAASESGVDLGSGPTDVVAVLAFEGFSGSTGLTLFDVRNPRSVASGSSSPFPYAGFVTTVVPGQGFGSDLVLHERYAYVASGAAGLQVVDLRRARELFLAENPDPLTSIPWNVSKALYSRGQGFGQEAILGAATYEEADVLSVAVDESLSGMHGYLGLRDDAALTYRFATVDLTSPFAPAPLASIPLVLAGKALGWPNRVVATAVGGRRFAIVVGGVSGQGRLAVVEVTDPMNPVVQAIVDLEGSWGKSVTLDPNGTVYVGTPLGVEAYSVLDPAEPKLLGVLPSVVTGVGEAMVTNGLAVGAGKNAYSAERDR